MSHMPAMRSDLSAKDVRRWFDYDPKTGWVVWRESATAHSNVNINKRAGQLRDKGYRKIMINNTAYLEHRIIWLWMTGKWPKVTIDHINRKRDDNRWENLREATMQQQAWNASAKSTSKTGIKGVYRRGKKWAATIQHDGTRNLGSFDTREEALAAYQGAARIIQGAYRALAS